MIRPLTLITMILAAGSGAYLFAVKHRAQVLDDQLAATAQASRLDAQRLRVLQAQWALEIDPTRLSQLAAQFTTLQPMRPAQLVTLASLQTSLPGAGSPPPSANPLAPAVVVIAPAPAGSDAPAPPATGPVALAAPALSDSNALPAASALPLPPPLPVLAAPQLSAPQRLATANVPAPSAAPPAIAPDGGVASAEAVLRRLSGSPPAPADHSALQLANTRAAEKLPPPRPIYAASAPSQLLPRNAPTGAPMGATVMSVKAVSAPPPVSESALGMAADLAPPQPLSGGNSN